MKSILVATSIHSHSHRSSNKKNGGRFGRFRGGLLLGCCRSFSFTPKCPRMQTKKVPGTWRRIPRTTELQRRKSASAAVPQASAAAVYRYRKNATANPAFTEPTATEPTHLFPCNFFSSLCCYWAQLSSNFELACYFWNSWFSKLIKSSTLAR
ncbi:unnamed protein product [Ixodes persulcatus]